MKNQVAAEAVALARLARAAPTSPATVKFAATADEEGGDDCGARWLCEHRPELVRCDYLLNEGMGGLWLPVDGRRSSCWPSARRPSPSSASARAAAAATARCR